MWLLARFSEGEPNVETYELRYLFPTTASIAGGGSAVAVAFTTGQVGFLRDGAWIEPDVLQAERSAHNGYQHGWAALDPDGELLLTRRDSADLELWAASGSGLERLGRLANSDASEAPDFASFSGDDITVASATAFHYDTGTATAVTTTWSLAVTTLLEHACDEVGSSLPAGARAAGVDRLERCASNPSG